MLRTSFFSRSALVLATPLVLAACHSQPTQETTATTAAPAAAAGPKYLAKPLISTIYTADPSAHVFEGKIYLYPSHDIEAGIPENDNGDHFAMRDYHILSLDSVGGKVTDHGVALDIKDIPWAGRQLWAPDAAFKNGTYYLYFPVKDKHDVFRLGVATSKSPSGPFKADPAPIAGSYSIDPAVFTDTDGQAYLYFGGLWGGQLQRWKMGKYDPTAPDKKPDGNEPAVGARVARLGPDMQHFAGPVKEITILDSLGKPLKASDSKHRFFEGGWLHKYQGKYYFSYSTGDTHLLVYAVGHSPTGPFTYKGVIMKPVQGWTTHHSILEFKGKWYIFYHDTELSNKTWLRNVKVTELKRSADGSIATITP